MVNKRMTFFKKRLTNLVKKISKPFSVPNKVMPQKVEPKATEQAKDASSDKKKVLMFGWELPPFNSGGLGVACYGIADAIAKKNTDVTFVLPKRQNIKAPFGVEFADYQEKKNSSEDKTLTVRSIDSPLSPYITAEEYARLVKEKGLEGVNSIYGNDLIAEVLRYGEAAADLAKKEKFDVIHAHDWLAYPAGIKAKAVSGKPLVAQVHALEYDRSHELGLNLGICAIEKEGLEKADKVIAISQYVKNRIIRFYHIDPAKIEVVHNGAEMPEKPKKKYNFSALKRNGTKIVLFVGRITYQKGVEYLVSAASKALSYNKNLLFVIVGTGDSMYRIIDQAASLGIADKVLFPGFLRGMELEKLYRAADVFVMPSVSEPFGLVALEALTNNVPVILSKQSGAAEVIKHSLTVNFWDTDELANKILAVTHNGTLRRSLSTYGFKDAKKCTWSAAADKFIRIYKGLCSA